MTRKEFRRNITYIRKQTAYPYAVNAEARILAEFDRLKTIEAALQLTSCSIGSQPDFILRNIANEALEAE